MKLKNVMLVKADNLNLKHSKELFLWKYKLYLVNLNGHSWILLYNEIFFNEKKFFNRL